MTRHSLEFFGWIHLVLARNLPPILLFFFPFFSPLARSVPSRHVSSSLPIAIHCQSIPLVWVTCRKFPSILSCRSDQQLN
ncbi:hypothetical protein GGR50DRAFT_464922 [Xylaria sp. CBS 124048]|nr:hypothetical protein GGR50DRAFT_464922 [Xylaria sp. CBS 124048]